MAGADGGQFALSRHGNCLAPSTSLWISIPSRVKIPLVP
jgi:hypothetical protein